MKGERCCGGKGKRESVREGGSTGAQRRWHCDRSESVRNGHTNVRVASGAKRNTGADVQDTRGLELTRVNRGRRRGKGGFSPALFVGGISFGRLFLGGLLAIPNDIRRSWISTLINFLSVQ